MKKIIRNIGILIMAFSISTIVFANQTKLKENFFAAINEQNIENVRKCLEKGLNPNVKDDEGKSLLHHVVGRHSDALEILIEYGADVNAVDKSGVSVFQEAIENDNYSAVNELLKFGVRIDTEALRWTIFRADHFKSHGEYPYGHLSIMKSLLKREIGTLDMLPEGYQEYLTLDSRKNMINDAIRKGYINLIKDMVRSSTVEPSHLLFDAVEYNKVEIVKVLLDLGAEPAIKDNEGKTPLDYAREREKKMIVEVLTKQRER